MVTPSYMLAIADEFERQGLDPRRSSLRVACSAPSRGPTPCAMRSRGVSTASALDLYGLSEVIGPGVACECAETQGRPA